MEDSTAQADRVLGPRVRQRQARCVEFCVVDHGAGIAADVAWRLFTPFFTTCSEGMGLGLSLCRTVIEQHGGVLDFQNLESAESARGVGAEFGFTLLAVSSESARRPQPKTTEPTP